MNIQVQNKDDLARALVQANADQTAIGSIDLGALNRILNYSPEDMTVTVQSGMNLKDLQVLLAVEEQCLPLDPPFSEKWTIRDLIDLNPSGPRRCALGTLRDHVIGLEAVRANGEIIKSGGQVVKNVAGFDLCKLFIGANGSLGVITSVTFKLLPLPEKEVICCSQIESFDELTSVLKRLRSFHRDAMPGIMDLYRDKDHSEIGTLIVGFHGPSQAVEQSSATILDSGLGFEAISCWERNNAMACLPELNHDKQFWANRSWRSVTVESVLRSRLPAIIEQLPSEKPFVARMGQGIVYHLGNRITEPKVRPRSLELRMKQQFDPIGILPELP